MTDLTTTAPPVTAAAWRTEVKQAGLPRAAVIVACRILDGAGPDATELSAPTAGELADACELDRADVLYGLRLLRVRGWLTRGPDQGDQPTARLAIPRGGA